MREISCNIIRDLLPSYVDEICSDETRELMEVHLQTCEECRQVAERMKMSEIKMEMEEHIEVADYMKKLKRHVQNKSLVNFFTLFVVMTVGLAAVFYINSAIPVFWYYAAVPVLSLSAYILLLDYTYKNIAARWKVFMLFISILDIIYMGILENWLIHSIQTQSSEIWLGPFAYRQFMVIALSHVVLFVGAVYMNMRTGNTCHVILVTSAAGGCASLAFAALLKRLDTPQGFLKARNTELGVIVAEGLALLLVFWILERRRKRG